jgi:hypothetical protein
MNGEQLRHRVIQANRRRRNCCGFCGIANRDFACWPIYPPMLRMDLWRRIAGDRWRQVMCLRCMLRKVGRPLVPQWDFKSPWWWYETTPTRTPRHLDIAPRRRMLADR